MTKKITIDVSQVGDRTELHELLSESLSFPTFYGKNWDAFWDAITGLIEMPDILELRGIEKLKRTLPKDAVKLITCLKDLGKDYPEIHCEVRYI
ncbi:MAG: barstar family protein [Steroidobacteraceae bacterium]